MIGLTDQVIHILNLYNMKTPTDALDEMILQLMRLIVRYFP